MTTAFPDPVPAPEKPVPARRKRAQVDSEALLSPLKPITNWQAKFAWSCACWGLIPVLGLPLGASATAFGLLGCMRAWARPDDLGRRAAIGGTIVGGVELLCNAAGVYFLVNAWRQLNW
jgi:hypothetical protein